MRKLLLAIVFTSALGSVGSAGAQVYPSRPITVIMPFAAGGPLDTIGRIMAERMRVSLGQTVIIENVTGAAGSIAVCRGARPAPDGYTPSIGRWAPPLFHCGISARQYDLVTAF